MVKRILLLLCIMIILSCSTGKEDSSSNRKTDIRKPMSWGHQQSIYIFADSKIWRYAKKPLKESLERVQFTTENETYFTTEYIDFSKLEQFYKFNNLIFFCNISSDDEVSKYVKSIMGEKVTEEIEENTIGIYPQYNLWASDQQIIFLLGNNEENLLKLNILQADRIFNLFKDKLYERIGIKLYKYKTHPSNLFAGYPWKIELPKTYMIYKEDRDNNFNSYLARNRDKPDRFIAVYYEKIEKELMTRDWLKEKRASLVWNYYDEDEFKDRDIRIENHDIGDHKGWKLSGRWQNMKFLVGGAFQSFAFYDDLNGRAYLIDNSVYFPEGYKLTSLMELEIISNTIFIK